MQTANTNFLDRMISAISPQAGVARAQARMQLDVMRKYQAAETGRRTQDWKAGAGSANAETLGSIVTLRNRSRQMVRDNPYAKKAIATLATHIVGTGITVIPELKSERILWQRWTENDCDAAGQLDFAGLCRLGVMAWKEGGEFLVRRRFRRPEDGLSVPLQIQLLEPDHLDHSRTGINADTGNPCIMGVEFDLLGRRVAYWLFDEHPGEVTLLRRNLQSRRIPASEVLHIYRKDRITQVRGVPELAVSLMRLRDLDGYEQAELVRKKIEACFTAFVTTDEPRKTVGELEKEQTGRSVEKISPGLIKYLTTGESVTFGTPSSMGGYSEYTADQLHAIAVGAGVTYPQLTGNTSRSNYTSHRAGLLDFHALIDQEQWLTFIPMFIRPVRAWWREAAQIAGVRVGNKPDRITTPRKQVVDPLKDTMGDKQDVLGGLDSLSEKIRARGQDPETVFAEIAAERARLKELGIALDTDASVALLKLDPTSVLALDQSSKDA